MQDHSFTWKGETINVFTRFIDDEIDWGIRYLLEPNVFMRYKIFYPYIIEKVIKVEYAWTIETGQGKILSSGRDYYLEKKLSFFYHARIGSDITYGHFAAINAVNGLVDRLAKFGGTKAQPLPIRVFSDAQAGLVNVPLGTPLQPVSYDLALTDCHYEEGVQTPNGQIQVTPVDGIAPFSFVLTAPDQSQISQSTGGFTELVPGSYLLIIEDSVGSRNRAEFQLSNTFGDLELAF